jgi:hypothetical protein
MFAWAVAIFRDKYLEIGHRKGECNREIDLFRVMVCREFPTSDARWVQVRVFARCGA